MNRIEIENIFTFTQYSAIYLADYLGKDKTTIYSWGKNVENIPYGKILLLEKLTQNTNYVSEPAERYKPSHELELEAQIEKLKAEKDLFIRTINEISAYNIELQNKLKNK